MIQEAGHLPVLALAVESSLGHFPSLERESCCCYARGGRQSREASWRGQAGQGKRLGRRQEEPQAQSLPGPQKPKVQNRFLRPSQEQGTGQGNSRLGGSGPTVL